MSRGFLTLFVATVTLGLLAFAAARSALAGGGALTATTAIALGSPAVLGLATLVRIAYLDGRARGHAVRRRP